MNKVAKLLSTCFGLGHIPIASGTVASGLGAIIYWFGMRQLIENRHLSNLLIYSGALVVLFIVGVLAARVGEAIFGESDGHFIVIDEVVGYLVAMFALPPTLIYVLLAFLLFRIFDILKPPPIRYIHSKAKGGLGVMLDDLVSGAMTCVLLHIVDFGVGPL
jgi:phosphatidylglycerophosphatase A